MNTCGTSHRKSIKHRPEHQRLTAKWRRLTRSGGRRYRWSHSKPPRAPTEPNLRGDAPPQELTLINDGNRQQRHCARGATMRRDRPTRPRQRKGGGHAQDIARERQQSSPHKRTRTPPRRSEGWNERATPTGPLTEEQTRDRCRTPEEEGPSREARTLADSLPQ